MNAITKTSLAAALCFAALPAMATGILPAPAPAPVAYVEADDWSGGYVGGSLAGISGHASYCDDGAGAPYLCDDLDPSAPQPELSGAIYGITGGYDWQNGMMVYGVAGDLLFGDLSGTAGDTSGPGGYSYGCGSGCGLEISSIAMLRGRVGYDMGDFLPYATAGIAVTQGTAFTPGIGSADDTFTNLVVGVGAEYRVSEPMSVSFDLLHLLEGNDAIYNEDGLCDGCGAAGFTATIARVSLLYRF